MNVLATARSKFGSSCAFCEEIAVVFLDVSIAVPAAHAHQVDIEFEPGIDVIGTRSMSLGIQHPGQLKIQGVFTGAEVLVVMDSGHSPIARLIVEDVSVWVYGLIIRAPKDAVRVRVFWGDELVEESVITAEGESVVVPMDWHGEGVSD